MPRIGLGAAQLCDPMALGSFPHHCVACRRHLCVSNRAAAYANPHDLGTAVLRGITAVEKLPHARMRLKVVGKGSFRRGRRPCHESRLTNAIAVLIDCAKRCLLPVSSWCKPATACGEGDSTTAATVLL
jgi:hypothetical protein